MFKSERDGETMKQKNPINQEVEDGDAGWGLVWAVRRGVGCLFRPGLALVGEGGRRRCTRI